MSQDPRRLGGTGWNCQRWRWWSSIFDPQRINDIPAEIAREIAGLSPQQKIKQGDTVAITAGSRGIVNIDVITKAVVDELRKRGAQPFIFPAMGSHGGATVEGQLKFWKNTE